MIVFSTLGKPWMGNLGNQLFQIASTIGIAQKNSHNFAFPEWKYQEYFIHELPKYDESINYTCIDEITSEHHEYIINKGDYDLRGYFQSEFYFDKEITKKYFSFNADLATKINQIVDHKNFINPILISVRRGDFVHHPQYHQLDYRYYYLALIINFKDWRERTVVWISDDIDYCKFIFSHFENFFFSDNLSAIEQLVLSQNCNDFIISNSTFSWWAAYLSEKQNSKVIRPIANFRGKYLEINSDIDFYPNRWLPFDPSGQSLCQMELKIVVKGEILNLISLIQFMKKEVIKYLRRFYARFK